MSKLEQLQYVIEGIILRRLHEKRIEGYTIETAKEMAEAVAALQSSAVSAPVAYLHQRRDSVAEPQLGFEVARNPQWTSEPLYRAVQQAAPTLAAETSRADENSRSLHETMKRVVQIRELAEQVIEMRWLFEPQSQAVIAIDPADLWDQSCGDTACVNPHHLSWKTPSENGLDCRKHGTHVRSRYGCAGKITSEQADTIRGLKGIKTLRELSDEYGVSESAISNVWVGRTHYRPNKIIHWKPDEDAVIRDGIDRGLASKQIADLIPGRTAGAVDSRARRLGLAVSLPQAKCQEG